ncbi:hypothetical protein RB595_006908 [Gaeumannomyces hyphopodioides]
MLGCSIATTGGLTGMADFRARLSPGGFGPVVHGFVVGAFPIGCLVGCILAGRFADTLGLVRSMLASAIFACVGISIQIATVSSWPQFVAGKLAEGFAIGVLSVITPMYHAETAPAGIRAMVTVSFQIMVVSGILMAQILIYGTSTLTNSISWRLPLALEMLIAIPLGIGSFFLPESPRLLLSQGREQEASVVIAKLNGVEVFSHTVLDQIQAFQEKSIEAESQGRPKRHEMFTAPAMARRLLIGIMLQAGQQLTGVNFFFYFGNDVLSVTGIGNGYVCQIILGAVNLIATLFGIRVASHCRRRQALIVGALIMFACFMVFSTVGEFALARSGTNKSLAAGLCMLAVAVIFIAAFAVTWGPLVWAVCAELFPPRHRSAALAVATAANWTVNAAIGVSTSHILAKIHFLFGYFFAGSCLALALGVWLFLIEPKDRTMEEIDQLYLKKAGARKVR